MVGNVSMKTGKEVVDVNTEMKTKLMHRGSKKQREMRMLNNYSQPI